MKELEITLQQEETRQKERQIYIDEALLAEELGIDDSQWGDIDGNDLAAAIVKLQERGLVREEFFDTRTIGGVSNLRVIGLDKGGDTFYSQPLRKSTTKYPKRLFEKGHNLAEYFGMNGTHSEYGED